MYSVALPGIRELDRCAAELVLVEVPLEQTPMFWRAIGEQHHGHSPARRRIVIRCGRSELYAALRRCYCLALCSERLSPDHEVGSEQQHEEQHCLRKPLENRKVPACARIAVTRSFSVDCFYLEEIHPARITGFSTLTDCIRSHYEADPGVNAHQDAHDPQGRNGEMKVAPVV
jgi:hypothetical protein